MFSEQNYIPSWETFSQKKKKKSLTLYQRWIFLLWLNYNSDYYFDDGTER